MEIPYLFVPERLLFSIYAATSPLLSHTPYAFSLLKLKLMEWARVHFLLLCCLFALNANCLFEFLHSEEYQKINLITDDLQRLYSLEGEELEKEL